VQGFSRGGNTARCKAHDVEMLKSVGFRKVEAGTREIKVRTHQLFGGGRLVVRIVNVRDVGEPQVF